MMALRPKMSKAAPPRALGDAGAKPKLCLITLGCKANQYDSAALLGYLSGKYVLTAPGPETPADLYLINSCTVTLRADFDARLWMRRARKWNPAAKIIVTGCLATNPEGLKDEASVPLFGVEARDRLLAELGGTAPKLMNDIFFHPQGGLQFRSRASVKVQDGCNYRCSYCFVPYARGKSRSLSAELVLDQIRALSDQGFEEVVLCGINLGDWGGDLGLKLEDLLEKISAARLKPRLRLSSLEPMAISSGLIDAIAGAGLVCPHLHLPLQSGDNAILRMMKRPYSAQDFLQLAQVLLARIPSLCLGLDVMTGFPGEGEQEFQNTLALLKQIPFGYLHIFTFSPRPNTPAARLQPKVPEKIAQTRGRILAGLHQAQKLAFARSQLGKNLEMVVENRAGDWVRGRTENYLLLKARSPARVRQRVKVRLLEAGPEDFIGEEIENWTRT